MIKKILNLALLSISLLNSFCIHTHHFEHEAVDLSHQNQDLKQQNYGLLGVESLIYTPDKLPLEDFFHGMKSGQYREALRNFRLVYKPGTSNNEALTRLIDGGLTPVYVRLTNNSPETMNLSEKNFYLTHDTVKSAAMNPNSLPTEFKRISPEAMAANAFNVGVVVIGVASVLGILFMASHGGNTDQLHAPSSSGSGPERVFNHIEVITLIDYENYLLRHLSLQPGENREGLLFFKLQKSQASEDLNLQYVATAAVN